MELESIRLGIYFHLGDHRFHEIVIGRLKKTAEHFWRNFLGTKEFLPSSLIYSLLVLFSSLLLFEQFFNLDIAPFSHTNRITIVKEILNIILSQSFKTRGYIAVSLTAFYIFCTCVNYAYILDVKKVFEYGGFDYPRISSIFSYQNFQDWKLQNQIFRNIKLVVTGNMCMYFMLFQIHTM